MLVVYTFDLSINLQTINISTQDGIMVSCLVTVVERMVFREFICVQTNSNPNPTGLTLIDDFKTISSAGHSFPQRTYTLRPFGIRWMACITYEHP